MNDWKPAQELGYQFDQSPPPHVLQYFKNKGVESVPSWYRLERKSLPTI